ncbi:MAG TPA: leucyl aminopeptidase [Acidothermaceae bacterium]|nr:leucyl aminopeptidase [Acidothermaceae bacterium]
MPPTLKLVAAVPSGVSALVIGITPGQADDEGAVFDRGAITDLKSFGADPAALQVVLSRDKVKGKVGDITAFPTESRLVFAVGLGDRTPRDFRRAGAAIARRLKSIDTAAVTVARRSPPAQVRALAEGLLLGGYSFKVTNTPKPEVLKSVSLVVERSEARAEALRDGVLTASASLIARDLANTPSSTKTPAWLGKQAIALARKSGLEVTVRDDRELRANGFGGVIAVGMGSANPPRLIELTYTPDPETAVEGHVVLIGKGITFDSGGLSLKPNAGMIAMKTDMAAGGAVIAAMSAMRDLGVRVRVTGLVPAAENMPSGSAQRPSDVITQYGGTTVEVLNTDAEGRLVLADALAYADLDLDPDVIVDLATLTGAISSGLGKRHAGLFTEDDRLAAALIDAGDESGEIVWRMPLVDDYSAVLESSVADLANVAVDGGRTFSGGAIVAALFLREFVGRRRWAHLDIAGVGRAEADEHEVTKGPTGFGVRLLLHWLSSADPLRGLR